MKTISFRIDDEQHSELSARADLAGVSVHDLARKLCLRGLAETNDHELFRREVGKVSGEVSELRRDLGSSVQLLLFALGKIPIEEAKGLVEELLTRSGSTPTRGAAPVRAA